MLITASSDGTAGDILRPPDKAFAAVGYDIATGIYTFGHEIGHLLGAEHGQSAPTGAEDHPYSFGHGYVDPNKAWYSVMAYSNDCSPCFRPPVFSNPNMTILGEPAGNAIFADNARVLNLNTSAFASFRGETYADLSGEGTLLENGAIVTGIGEYRNKSKIYVVDVPAGATNLRIETSSGNNRGNLTLYVKAKAMAVPGFSDCTSRIDYSNDEECVFAQPAATEATSYHILLYANSGFSDVTLSVEYSIPLSIDPLQLPLDDLNKLAYTVTGTCPSADGDVTIKVGTPDTDIPVTATCDSSTNTFTKSLDVSGVTSNPATITVTQGTGSHISEKSLTVNNEITIPLAIDTEQLALTEANKLAYGVTGTCDASEYGSNITVKIGNPETADTLTTCHASSNTFDVTVNASGVVSNPATLTVTHGILPSIIQTTSTVANNVLVPFSISSLQPALDDTNKDAYIVTGTCDSSVTILISVSMASPVAAALARCDLVANTFSAAVNASGVTSNPATITIVFNNGDSRSRDVANNMTIIPLSIDSLQPALNDTNKLAYTVTGTCNSSVASTISVIIGTPNTTEVIVPCESATDTFSAEIDASGVLSSTATITVTHNGNNSRSRDVPNNMTIPFSISSSQPALDDTNKLAYTVTGTCPSASGTVTVNVGTPDTDPPVTATCDSLSNTFTATGLDVSGVTSNPATITVTQGGSPIEAQVGNIIGCSNVAPAPTGYSNLRPHTIVYKVSSTSFYIMDLNELTAEAQQFELCLSPDLKVTAELSQSYITENNSLVWEGQMEGTPASLTHQLANSAIFVKRNGELISTVWANGYVYRIWPLGSGLHQIEKLTGPSVFDETSIIDPPIPEITINAGDHIPEISVMVVFTSNANDDVRDIYAFSDLAVAEANFSYRASGIQARLKLAHVVNHSYDETDSSGGTSLGRMRDPSDGHMDNIHALRDQYEADIGVLITANGTAVVEQILANPENAFAYSQYDVATGVYSFVHEIGHLLGAQHLATPESPGSSVPYAFGHGYLASNDLWRTIMAYDNNCDAGCFRLPIFSSPNITIQGEAAGTTVLNDNVRVLNRNASAFASFRGETYADLSGEGILLETGAVVTGIADESGRSALYVIDVPSGATNLRIETSGGAGNVHLYVKATAMATPGFGDCAPKKYNNDEICVFAQPEATRYHVLLYGQVFFSDVTLSVQYDHPLNLKFDLLEILTDTNKSSYTVSGTCDSSISGNITVEIASFSVSETTPCNANNTFSIVLDLSSHTLTGTTLAISLSYGSKTVTTDINLCVTSGSGTSSDPKMICTYTDLNSIRSDVEISGSDQGSIVDKYYTLGANIDASPSWSEGTQGCTLFDGTNLEAATCEGWVPLPKFKNGRFNGQDHEIRNLYIQANQANVGMFSEVEANGNRKVFDRIHLKGVHVRNIQPNDSNLYYGTSTGVLAGFFNFPGSSSSIHIDGCSVEGTVIGATTYSGGLLGILAKGNMANSYAHITVRGSLSVGGLVGYSTGTIYNSYSQGSVQGEGDYVGGLVAVNIGYIYNSYSRASVSGTNSIGSLVGGTFVSPTFSSSYGVGQVTLTGNNQSPSLGGLVGSISGSISNRSANNFWDTDSTGLSTSAIHANLPQTSLTTAEMQSDCLETNSSDAICDLGDAFIFTAGSYPKLKTCTTCREASPVFSEDLVGDQDSTKPDAPQPDAPQPDAPSGFSLHNLSSPGNDSTPEIVVEGVEPLATVELFSDSSCSTSVSSQETVLQNASTITITANVIASNSTITYYALQTDEAGNPSDCSTESISYEYVSVQNLTPLSISSSQPALSNANKTTYPVTGTCNSSTAPTVSVVIGSPNTMAITATCNSVTNTFSAEVNASGITSNRATITITHDGDSISKTVANNIRILVPTGLSLHNPSRSPSNDSTPEITVSGVELSGPIAAF